MQKELDFFRCLSENIQLLGKTINKTHFLHIYENKTRYMERNPFGQMSLICRDLMQENRYYQKIKL